MFHTNRQSFLAELNSLLSFMQEDDRKTALSMYSKMFDSAPSEQELLNHLVSPTRQAVRLARVYDSSAATEGGNTEFVDEISSAQPVSLSQDSGNTPSLENQTNLFAAQSAPVSKPSRRRQAWKDEAYQSVEPSGSLDVDAFISTIKVNDEISAAESVRSSGAESLSKDFPGAEENAVAKDVPAIAETVSAPVIAAVTEEAEIPVKTAAASAENVSKKAITKTNVPLLILYTIFAIPVTSLIIVLVILLAVSFLGLASASGYVGFLLVSSAFGGFAMFSDIMVVLGVSLVLAALAVLFLWIFVWLLGGVIVAAVKGAINLGGRLCVREVEA